MPTIILMSIMVVSVVVPAFLSARRAPRPALRRAQWITIAFVFVWAAMCIHWYPRLVPLE